MNLNDIVLATKGTALIALLTIGTGCAVRIGPTNVGQKPIKAIPSSQLVWVNERITFSKSKMTIHPTHFVGITSSPNYRFSNLEHPAGYFAIPAKGIGSSSYLLLHPNYPPQQNNLKTVRD